MLVLGVGRTRDVSLIGMIVLSQSESSKQNTTLIHPRVMLSNFVGNKLNRLAVNTKSISFLLQFVVIDVHASKLL